MNPAKLLKAKNSWDTFAANHPKFVSFLGAAKNGAVVEGSVIEITITTPDGKVISSNLKVKDSDIQAINDLR